MNKKIQIKKKTIKNGIKDWIANFFVSFDWGGFLKKINDIVITQITNKIVQPENRAIKKSLFILLSY